MTTRASRSQGAACELLHVGEAQALRKQILERLRCKSGWDADHMATLVHETKMPRKPRDPMSKAAPKKRQLPTAPADQAKAPPRTHTHTPPG